MKKSNKLKKEKSTILETIFLILFLTALGCIPLLTVMFIAQHKLEKAIPIIEIPRVIRNHFKSETVQINWVSETSEVNTKLVEYEEQTGQEIGGMADWTTEKNCTIWAYEPRGEDDRKYLEILGHEMLHCFRGHFHTN